MEYLTLFRPGFFGSFQTGGEYLINHNETLRIYSMSKNLSFDIATWDDDVTSRDNYIMMQKSRHLGSTVLDFKIFQNVRKPP